MIERELGAIQVPEPAAFRLAPSPAPAADEKIPALHRAMGQVALYALLEELIAEVAEPRGRASQLRLVDDAADPPRA